MLALNLHLAPGRAGSAGKFIPFPKVFCVIVGDRLCTEDEVGDFRSYSAPLMTAVALPDSPERFALKRDPITRRPLDDESGEHLCRPRGRRAK